MRRSAVVLLAALSMLAALVLPAAADHTDPDSPISPTPPGGEPLTPGIESGEGEWDYHVNFPPNPSSDHWYFTKGEDIFSTSGTLGGGAEGHVGQRILQLTGDDGTVSPRFVADHGSAKCDELSSTGNLGLQHDASVTPFADPELLLDATDSTGRCHDRNGGGIEIIDISGLGEEGFELREIGLVRFDNTTHTLTVDTERPWIVYSNNSTTNDNGNYNDVMDIRSCLTESSGGFLPDDATLETKRAECDPVVHRIPFKTEWTQGTRLKEEDGGEPQGSAAGCHDTTSAGDRLHCSGGFGDVILDVSGLTDDEGNLNGAPLECDRLTDFAGEDTGALVTDCTGNDNPGDDDVDTLLGALGIEFLGHFNHVGPDFLVAPFNPAFGLNNRNVPADEGVVFSHETRPLPAAFGGDRQFMVVTDERGGGALPGGATCTDDELDNEFGNGGLHFLDITDPANIEYATTLVGGDPKRAVWRGEVVLPSSNFCVIHRIQVLEDEQRVIMGYYSQGVKILDYDLDENGHLVFDEVASMILPGTNSWTTDAFRITDNDDGTRTYDMLSSDIQRGIDVFSWTGPTATRIVDPDAGGGGGGGDDPAGGGGGDDPAGGGGGDDPAGGGGDDERATIERLSGDSRFETAVEVARSAFEESETIFLARGDVFADALSGGPLAARQDAPILLTEQDRLTQVTEDEVRRLGASRAVLLGGDVAIGPEVVRRLQELGLDVERVEGPTRWATAAAVAKELGDDSGTVFLTEGDHAEDDRGWPDALSAAPYAAFSGQPILLTHHGILPDETRAALADAEAEETIVVGGSSAVSDEVFKEVEDAGHGPRRLAGSDRYATNVAVYNEAMAAGMAPGVLWVATGRNWPDALTAGAVAGPRGDMLVLVDGATLDSSPPTRDLIASRAGDIRHVNILGGVDAISANVATELRALFDAEESSAAAAAPPGSRGPFGGVPLPMSQEILLLLLLAGLLLPAAALFGRRRQARLPA